MYEFVDKLFLEAMDRIAEAVFITDEDANFIYANNFAASYLGYSIDEILKLNISDIDANHSDSTDIKAKWHELIDKKVDRFDTIHRCKNGKLVPVEISPIFMQHDGALFCVSFVRDIKVNIEQDELGKRLTAESFRNLLLSSIGDGVYGIDKSGNCTFINGSALQMLGFDSSEVLGHNTHELFHHSSRDKKPHPKSECPAYHTLSDGMARVEEDTLIRKNGEFFDAHLKIAPLKVSEKVVGAVIVFHDMTERVKMQEELKQARADAECAMRELETIYHNAPIGISVTKVLNASHRILLRVNRFYEETMFGYEQGELVGKPVQILYPSQEEFEKAGHVVLAQFASGMRSALFESNVIRKDGTLFLAQGIVSLVDANDLSKGVITLVQDITEERRAEEAIKTLNQELMVKVEQEVARRMQVEEQRRKEREQLIQSEKMAQLGNMLGVIIHQWKQPLTILSIAAEDLKVCLKAPESCKEDINSDIKEIMQQISFMNDTANDFGDFYKPSKTKTMFSLTEEVCSVVKIFSKQLKAKNITVSVDGDEGICTEGYVSEFKQVLLNIINNAKDEFEAKKTKEPKISISISQDGDTALLVISDNGGGIDEQMLPCRLFESFVSAKGEKGTGIGLSICKSIIEENMGGKLTAYNFGEGAAFRIELPIR